MFNLVPYTRTENSLFRWFDELEKSVRGDIFGQASQFRTDIVDKGDSFELHAELPGFDKEDIHVDVNGDMLTISACHSEEKSEENENVIHRERRVGSFCRRFDLSGVKADKIRAEYKNGVLTLELPKREPQQLPPSRQIKIES